MMGGCKEFAAKSLAVVLGVAGMVVGGVLGGAAERMAGGETVNIGIVDRVGMPGSDVQVPVVLLNHTDDAVVSCSFKISVPTATPIRFIGLADTAEHWNLEWGIAPDSDVVGHGGVKQSTLTVQAWSASAEQLYGRLELIRLLFRIGENAMDGQRIELGVDLAVVRCREGVPTTTTQGGSVAVGDPVRDPSPLSVLACVSSPEGAECRKYTDVDGDGEISVKDAVEAIQLRDGLNRCVERIDDSVEVFLQGPNRLTSTYAEYRLRVAKAEGMMGLRAEMTVGSGCRIVGETPILRGGYALGTRSMEDNSYTVLLASGDWVTTNDTIDVFSIKLAQEGNSGGQCLTITEWDAYAGVFCTGVEGVVSSREDSRFGMAGAGGMLVRGRVNAVRRGEVLCASGLQGTGQVSLYRPDGRRVFGRTLSAGAPRYGFGFRGVSAGVYLMVVRDAEGSYPYTISLTAR